MRRGSYGGSSYGEGASVGLIGSDGCMRAEKSAVGPGCKWAEQKHKQTQNKFGQTKDVIGGHAGDAS